MNTIQFATKKLNELGWEIENIENKQRELKNKRDLFIKEIDKELNLVNASIRDAVKELTGISDGKHTWIVGDVFTTRFWGVSEVCLIRRIANGYIVFTRLESIRSRDTIKKDYCAAEMEVELFLKIGKTFLHHSEWHIEYRDVV